MSEQKISNKKNHLLSWIIFLPVLIIVLLSTILVIFPALPITFFDKIRFPVDINAFEPGIWMAPILISNTIIFATIILYRKNKLPQKITSLFRSILNFEISHRTALVLIGVLISSYVILTAGELYTEEPWADYAGVKKTLDNFSPDDVKFHFKMIPNILAFLTMEIFGSYRVAPFIASIFCLFLTYLVTVQLSKKRFAGIIALGIVLQSESFLVYDTLITYPIFWIMFFLLSIYFVFKSLFLPVVSYTAMVISHPLSLGFFPITIPFIVLLDLPKRKKIFLLLSYSVLVVIGLVLIFAEIIPLPDYLTVYLTGGLSASLDSTSSLDVSRIISAFASIFTQFRYDALIVTFSLPLVVCLFLASKQGISNANAVLALIGGVILLVVFVPLVTGQGNTPYRILPLVFFFAIGVGTLLSKNINLENNLLAYSTVRENSKKRDDEKSKERLDTIENSEHKSPSNLRRAEERKKKLGRS